MPLASNQTYVQGEVTILRGTFRDESTGVLIDPDQVVLTMTDPNGVVTIADNVPASGNLPLDNPSTGIYEFRLELLVLKTWLWDYQGSNAIPLSSARRGGKLKVIKPA